MPGPIYEGQETRIYTVDVFENGAGVATNPSTVTLTLEQPDGTQDVYHWPTPADLTNYATGGFEKLIIPPEGSAGIWQGQWESTGTPSAVDRFTFRVRPAL